MIRVPYAKTETYPCDKHPHDGGKDHWFKLDRGKPRPAGKTHPHLKH